MRSIKKIWLSIDFLIICYGFYKINKIYISVWHVLFHTDIYVLTLWFHKLMFDIKVVNFEIKLKTQEKYYRKKYKVL